MALALLCTSQPTLDFETLQSGNFRVLLVFAKLSLCFLVSVFLFPWSCGKGHVQTQNTRQTISERTADQKAETVSFKIVGAT